MNKASQISPRSNWRHALPAPGAEETDKVDFLQKARRMYQQDVDADRHNIEPAREDIQFVIGDQWDLKTKQKRTRLNKPVLTVNRLPAFVAQYLGSWQQTDTTMKLMPMKGGSRTIAEVRQGLLRTIIRTPIAKHATYTAMETAYIGGIGNFGLELVDNKYDIFDKDMQLVAFDDPFQVIWDRSSREPTGADAMHCFAMHYITRDDFKKAYPDAPNVSDWGGDDVDYSVMTAHGWEIDEMLRICHFWQMQEEPATVGIELDSNDVVDITDWDDEQIENGIKRDDEGNLITRETVRPYAECYVLAGNQVLDGPFRLNISRLPVFRVEGWALQEASVRYRWGFVRNAKDPQRLHNYWRSVLAEELMKSVASKWLLDHSAMKSGLADHFRQAHLSGDNVLFWDSQADGAKPEFIEPPRVNQAVMTEAGMTVQDIKDVTNKHEASLGVRSNEVSGKAINARQKVSELGDRIYLENMNMALAECAKVMNELIPEVYDTNRTIMITGDDDQVVVQEINGDFDDDSPDITKGKYELTYTTGPSYATKREEATETLLTMMNHMPQTANVIGDIIARNMDIPGSDEIATRLTMMMPDGVVDKERLPERDRLRVEAMQQRQQEQQDQNMQMQMMQFKKMLEEQDAKIQNLMSQAAKNMAQASGVGADIDVKAFNAEADYEIRSTQNDLKAAEVGVKLDKNDLDATRLGMEAAYKVAETLDQGEQERANGGTKNSEGGNASKESGEEG